MDDIVAVKVTTGQRRTKYLLTWGRVFDPIDDKELLTYIAKHLHTFGITKYTSITLCSSLQQASKAKFFYENYFLMTQKGVKFGPKYEAWRLETAKQIKEGKELYCLD